MKTILYKYKVSRLIICIFSLVIMCTLLFGCESKKESTKKESTKKLSQENVINDKKIEKDEITKKQNNYFQTPHKIDFKVDSKKVFLDSKEREEDIIKITNSINEAISNEGFGLIESSTSSEDLNKLLTNDYINLVYSKSISINLNSGKKYDFDKLFIPLDTEKECIIIGFKNGQQYQSDFGLLKAENKLKEVLLSIK